MASSMKGFEHLEIQLEEIKSATNNFNEENVIGHGGFGKVYKGELSHSHSEGKSMVALKRLDRRHGQGDTEFYKEVRMLSCYRHENIISLLGFSRGRDEMILVYEHASRGSLDGHLKDVNLTWTQRLKICLDAAKGLSYLHDPRETNQRLIHCDIKSANILLDENFKAKVSDFGLSKIGPANQQNSILHNSILVTGALGTPGYCDPLFLETYTLTKESDVYSFGVVLLEVLSGKLCFEFSNGQVNVLVPMWKQSYEENKLDEIILQDLMQQMDPSSLKTFSDIAFQCLRKAREERPTMSRVVEELEIALESQEFDLTKHEDILMAVDPLLIYKTGIQLKELLSKGCLITNEGKTWLSINKKGEHIERIYIEACLNLDKIPSWALNPPSDDFGMVNSRFPEGRCYEYRWDGFKARVSGQFLTPQISYTLNLVFRFNDESDVNSYNPLRYKIDGEAKVFIIYPSIHEREDGWFIVPLYHFTSQHKTVDLQFEFEDHYHYLLVAGIEFQPSEEKVQLPSFEEYQCIIEAASQSLFYTSLQELKQILSKGVYLNGYKTWFSINEKGEHCHMISMKDCLIPNEDSTPQYESHYLSRFPAGFYKPNNKGYKTHVKTQFLSPSITYTVNLVFYIYSSDQQEYVDLQYRLRGEATTCVVYHANPRDDYLYMAELYQFTSDGSIVDLEIIFENSGTDIYGVEGIMFQPLEKVEDQLLEDDKVEDIETISDSDTYWEQKIPNDYKETLKLSKDSLEWKTKKELYSILSKGFLLDNGQEWFSVDKYGKKCQILSARATVIDYYDNDSFWESSNESRFGKVLVITACDEFDIKGEIRSEVLSPETNYASYLVYKLPQDQSTFEAPLCVWERIVYGSPDWYIYLVCPPHTPVIGSKLDENTYNPLNRYKATPIPQQRSDGWMEVKVWAFQTTTKSVPMYLRFQHDEKLKGLMIQGIELRPI